LFARTQNALQAERRTYAVQSQTAWADLLRSRGTFSLHAAQGLTQVGSPVWQPEMEQAARNGEIVETAGAVALPLIVRGSVIAVLNIQRKGTRSAMNSPALNPDELAFLTNVTEQLANALDSARLYAETRQRAEQERLVADVSSRMRMSLDVEQVLETAIEDLYKALELESLTITLSPTGGPEGGQP
jgi:GAF domain-containing protein